MDDKQCEPFVVFYVDSNIEGVQVRSSAKLLLSQQ